MIRDPNSAEQQPSDVEPESVPDPRSARARILAAFGGAEEGSASGGTVSLGGTGDEPETDNPFSREAAEAEALRRIEALLFASPAPVSEAEIADRVVTSDLPSHLDRLQRHYENRGINLRRAGGGWQFVTASDVADVLVEHRTEHRRLSRAALETLAIIAYHQPCSRAEIEEIRGVAVAKGSLDQLMELGWVRLRGRREAPGRPVLYGTTTGFLEHFGLGEVSELPGLEELKAQGLLDARLPPGFDVPRPTDGGEDDPDGDLDHENEAPAFAVDYAEGEPPSHEG